jgi:HSP20 family molecular chaperone IbpA
MKVERMKVAPVTVVHADEKQNKLVVEFAIEGAPKETIDVKILKTGVFLWAPANDVDYVSALALSWPVKSDKAKATYERGLLRIEIPFKDPMKGVVKVAIKTRRAETKNKRVAAQCPNDEEMTAEGHYR